ncbi:putative 2-succinyl-6-hydroxy-2,4-cyclohexadiene-1-carboxylate synthase [Sporosarcina sp. NCCP-2716]|uniref:2-succinyl-6-hydroxy-2, 4-cyclohexadiene-1-carboxylate synthase n=1 Tax=Sporosarcina sp. NCCP-2716 TaxID=2943679 RepID=UPI002040DA18|nr:2-succinyl-6-hydroxy-2,4-cyclohexadiene-1-carboxylate synthase [Sporosarcina sp. NCCP-2716]GKV69418.1 putative 2-succinyl-6-hydroxy-2,4-cyclohexadiene-1-carboxylate synthase [Sporosarcina sp. NCCP-2716]
MASEWILTGNGRLHAEIYGDCTNPAIVMLHGFTGSTATWRTLAEELQDRYYVVLFDLWGHGRSSVPPDLAAYAMEQQTADLEQAVTALGLERFLLIGYSMGGRVAIGFSAAYPERISGLLLESASPGLREELEQVQRRRNDSRLAERLRREPLERFIDYWQGIPLFSTQRLMAAAVQDAVRQERLHQKPEGLANSLEGIGTGSQPSYWDTLPELRFPVLLVTGTLDVKFTKLAEKMEQLLPNAGRKGVEDAGHAVHVEKPEEFATIVKSFAAQHTL